MNGFLLKSRTLFEAAQDPEYRFLLLEPILSYGIAFGIILFVAGFLAKSGKLQIGGLLATSLCALAFMPYMSARRDSLPRIEQIYRFDNSARGKVFMDNTILWSASTWLYASVVIVATATVIVGARRNQLGYGLSIATIFLGLIAIQNTLWMNYQDASAVYPNLKAHRAPIEEVTKRTTTRSSARFPQENRPRENTYSSPPRDPGDPGSERRKFIRPIH